MVASGLVDRPSVSHFNLTVHLLLALALLGCRYGLHLDINTAFHKSKNGKWSTAIQIGFGFFYIMIIQITYGGMTAGLKAGHVSDTWP
jgi:cytochrome c oxidase assembly protein subunit 15